MTQTVAYLLATFGITAIGVGAIVSLEIARPEGYNSQAAYAIIGIVAPTLTVLIGLVKSIGNGQAIERVEVHAKAAADAVSGVVK